MIRHTSIVGRLEIVKGVGWLTDSVGVYLGITLMERGIVTKGVRLNCIQRCLRSSAAGAGKLTLLVFGTLVAIALIVSYHVLPFYYDYFELESQMDALVRVAGQHTDLELRDKLRQHLRRTELPFTIDDVRIDRSAGTIRMSVKYQELFYLTIGGQDYDLHTFDFHASAEGPID